MRRPIGRPHSRHAGGAVEGLTCGLPDDAFSIYAEHYFGVDPWFVAGRDSLPDLKAARGSDLVPDSRFRESEF